MFFKKSIRKRFLIQLIFSSVSLILIFSSILYLFIENSIYNEKKSELLRIAKLIATEKSLNNNLNRPDLYLNLKVEMLHLKNPLTDVEYYLATNHNKKTLTLIYPFKLDDLSYLKVTKDVTLTAHLLGKILNYIFIINIAGFVLIIFYAIGLSKMLISPITTLNNKLSDMNEHLMKPIKTEELPEEFTQLGLTINHLISRIQNFVKYQKELFIGTAHELKTPLAVIKLKNQVTLLKKRDDKEYIDAIKVTNKTIDEMNIVVSNILNIGRKEGAQLDKPVEIDIIDFLKSKANDFQLLAESENKNITTSFKPDGFMATLQIGLLTQVIQNFIQNALKFTPKDKKVHLQSSLSDMGLLIEVIDEGCGIDESVDLFAPFKRQGDKSGVGLGLFLAKSASDGLGAIIKLENRKDGVEGTIASLELNSKLSCTLPRKTKN